MKPEQINIAIAESLGWKQASRCAVLDDTAKALAIMCWIRPGANDWQEEQLPNYHGSLDACVEFEKSLSLNNKRRYYNALYDLTICGDVLLRAFRLVTATAPQRCEAYLKTINKWKEE